MVDKEEVQARRGDGWRKSVLRHVPAALILLVMVILLGVTITRQSPVQDEHFHLTRGLAFWWAGDSRLSAPHPPVGNALATLPAAVALRPIDFPGTPGWDRGGVDRANKRKVTAEVFSDYERGRQMLMWSRAGMVGLAVLFGIYFYTFLLSFFGMSAALCGLVLLAFNPTLLAHEGLVTTDFVAAAGTFLMVGELVRYLARSRRRYLFTFALAAGAGMMAKYTVFGVFLLVLVCWIGWTALKKRAPGEPRLRKWKRLFVELAIVGGVVLFVFNLSYQFERTGWRADRILASLGTPEGSPGSIRKALQALPGATPVPLPYTLVRGLAAVSDHVKRGHPSYFMGETSTTGWLSYFPVMIAIKTPVPVLLLLLWGVATGLSPPRRPSLPVGWLIAVSVGFMLMIIPSRVNIGVRHALPIVPLLTALAAVSASNLIVRAQAASGRLSRAILALPLAGVALMPVVATSELPDYLGYFNVFIGRDRGHAISVVGEDAGQDARELAEFAKRKKLNPLFYSPMPAPYSLFELEREGVKVSSFTCGQELPKRPAFIAVHAVSLLRLPECFPFADWAKLRHEINHHIRIYYVDPRRAPRGPKRYAPAAREPGDDE